MKRRFCSPEEIEKESMRIIKERLDESGKHIPKENLPVVMRAIHTTADFDYADNLYFSENAVERISKVLKDGRDIITDTNMCLSGINGRTLSKINCKAHCFMADPVIIQKAKEEGTTRAYAAMGYASERFEEAGFVSGNAPTALIRLKELMEGGYRPGFIIGLPVGFVNVVESKEDIIKACEKYDIPAIVARGNKGGSNVAAGIMNAILYNTK